MFSQALLLRVSSFGAGLRVFTTSKSDRNTSRHTSELLEGHSMGSSGYIAAFQRACT